jgi:TolB-like protein/DNA-binding SARP family transcriptional activator/Tfp pilus assembly protein PilF
MFRLKVLGGLLLESDSEKLPASAHQRRRLTLLVVLVRMGVRGMSRERLVSLLWPESTEESARHALDQLLYATRRDLGKHVVSSDGGQLRLDPHAVWSDVVQFELHLQRGEWEPAVGLYAGPFLDGVHLGDGLALDRWVDAERAALEERFVGALEHLARDAAERGDAQAAVAWWRRRVEVEPLSGRGALALTQALADAGDRVGALRYAHTYSVLLREELGTEANAELLALVARLTQEPAPAPAVEPNFPVPELVEPAVASAPSPDTESQPRHHLLPGSTPSHQSVRLPLAALFACVLLAIGAGWWTLPGGRRAEGTRAGAVAPAAPATRSTVDRQTVAVIPFVDMSPDRDHEYLADGITEELINALSRIEELRVVARTSAFTFKGQNADVREIGAKLGARTVLGGSIRRSGDRLRISVQLMEAENGYQIWSETYDRKLNDVFAIQEEISRAVVRTLRPALVRTADAPLMPASTRNAEAYQLYMQGRYFWNQRTEEGLRKAMARFEEAIRVDPEYALAYSGLSDAHNALTDNGYVPEEPALTNAEVAVRTALRLDPELAEAYTSLGHLKLHRWDWVGAEQDFRRSIELNPGYAVAYQYYAYLITFQGRFDEALPLIRRAQHLDPLSPAIQSNTGEVLLLARRFPEAVAQLRFALQMDSTRQDTRMHLASALTELRQYDDAITELQRVIATSDGWHRSAVAALGYTHARAGRRAEAERVRAEVERARREGRSLSPTAYASLLGALGRRDEAFTVLDQAYATDRGGLVVIAVEPSVDPLRSDPRFAAFLGRLNRSSNGSAGGV